MEHPQVSVVIPTKNAGPKLREILEMIYKQNVDYHFEVVVVDSGSKDETLEICKEFPIKLFEIKPDEFNHGRTRNFGISKTKGKYILLIVQDAIPFDESWMRALIQPFLEDPMVAGVYSRHLPHRDANLVIKKAFQSSFLSRDGGRIIQNLDYIPKDNDLTSRELYKFYAFNNVSSAIRRNVWEEFPFSAIPFAEDLDWSKRVIDLGYKIVYEPSSIVYHSHQRSVKEEFKRAYVTQKTISDILQGNENPLSFIKFLKKILNILIIPPMFFKEDITVVERLRTMTYAVSHNISSITGMFLANHSPNLLKRFGWYPYVEKKIISGL